MYLKKNVHECFTVKNNRTQVINKWEIILSKICKKIFANSAILEILI